MKLTVLACFTVLVAACSSTPRYKSSPDSNSFSSAYAVSTKAMHSSQANNVQRGAYDSVSSINKTTAALPVVVVSNFERLSYEELVRFEPDCEQRAEQLALLGEQLRLNRFYIVDGVEGNASPERISKNYYSLVKYRIWALRFACQGSKVSHDLIRMDLQAAPNLPPTATPRCYFEETIEAKIGYQQVNSLSSENKSTLKEICTNFPYSVERPLIRVGDQMSFGPGGIKESRSYSAFRKWKGNIYQLASKTEMHLNQAVRFTLVMVRSGVNQWTVVDKF